MADENKKENKTFLEKLLELSQSIGIILGVVMGAKKTVFSPGEKGGNKVSQLPMWLLELLPSLTKEDENEFNLIMSSFPEQKIRKIEAIFREKFKEEGYDEIQYRLGLVGMRREFMKRLKSPAPKDESGGRLKFEPVMLTCPAIDFLWAIMTCARKYPTEEIIYKHQREIGIDRLLLKKTSNFKKIVFWTRENKGKTLALVLSMPVVIFSFMVLILDLILG